jgi:hypothetical protein
MERQARLDDGAGELEAGIRYQRRPGIAAL